MGIQQFSERGQGGVYLALRSCECLNCKSGTREMKPPSLVEVESNSGYCEGDLYTFIAV